MRAPRRPALFTGTGASTGTNNLLGYVLVKDGSGTGMGQINGSNQIVRFDSTTSGPATTLTASSNDATTDFSTFVTIYSNGSTAR